MDPAARHSEERGARNRFDGTVPGAFFLPGYHPLALVFGAAASGVALERWSHPPLVAWFALGVVGLVIWGVLWRRDAARRSSARQTEMPRVRWGLASLLAAVAAAGGAWHHCRWNLFPEHDIARFAGEASRPVAIQARVARGARFLPSPAPDPLRSVPVGDRTRVELEALAVRDGRAWRPASGSITALVEGNADARAGDRLTVFGQLHGARRP